MSYRGGATTARRGAEYYREIGAKGGRAKKGSKHRKKDVVLPDEQPTPEVDAMTRLDDIIAEMERGK